MAGKTAAKRVREILDRLDQQYTTKTMCSLDYGTPWQLLIATMLSAQCTDERVNQVTRTLFVQYPSVQAFAEADLGELEQAIHSVGFYHSKARNLIGMARILHTEYQDTVPSQLEQLVALPGVGRKTANVIRGNIYHQPSIVVDTHVKRISGRLGLTREKEPEKVEQDLMKVLPEENWIRFNMQIITLGREICMARNPQCANCFLQDLCTAPDKTAGRTAAKTTGKTAGKTVGKTAGRKNNGSRKEGSHD